MISVYLLLDLGLVIAKFVQCSNVLWEVEMVIMKRFKCFCLKNKFIFAIFTNTLTKTNLFL